MGAESEFPKASLTAPLVRDEVIVAIDHTAGGAAMAMQMRRVTYVENGIVLGTPKVEPLSESQAIEILLNAVRAGAIRAISTVEQMTSPRILKG